MQELDRGYIMSREMLPSSGSLWTLCISSTTPCLAKAKLFTGESLGSDAEEGKEGEEEDCRGQEQDHECKESMRLTTTHPSNINTSHLF